MSESINPKFVTNSIASSESEKDETAAKVLKFLKKKDIDSKRIKYILHEGGKTYIYMNDGRKISTYTTASDIMSVLHKEDFFHINRGTYVAIKDVAHIDENIYTMADGNQLTGRAYQMEAHEQNKLMLLHSDTRTSSTLSVYDRFSGLNNMPIPFCVMEVIKDSKNNVDFIFRYCNQAMADYDHVPVDELIGRSVYDIFEEGDKVRLASYADVATNGRTHMLKRINPATGKEYIIYCFQPQQGFCACMLR